MSLPHSSVSSKSQSLARSIISTTYCVSQFFSIMLKLKKKKERKSSKSTAAKDCLFLPPIYYLTNGLAANLNDFEFSYLVENPG